jgi:hypothetical protein
VAEPVSWVRKRRKPDDHLFEQQPGRHPARRLLAGVIDGLCIVGWLGVVVAVGLFSYLVLGNVSPRSEAQQNLVALAMTTAPVTVGLSWIEKRWGASIGKRTVGLELHQTGSKLRPSFPVLLTRNVLKLGIPWTVAHAAVFDLVDSPPAATPAPWVVGALLLAYVLPLLYLASLFVGSGRTPYDRLLGLVVEPRAEDVIAGQSGHLAEPSEASVVASSQEAECSHRCRQ